MSLSYKLTGDILQVKSVSMSFVSTNIKFWYYDIKLWRTSSHGKENDPIDRDMDQGSIDWVKKNYLPKVGVAA